MAFWKNAIGSAKGIEGLNGPTHQVNYRRRTFQKMRHGPRDDERLASFTLEQHYCRSDKAGRERVRGGPIASPMVLKNRDVDGFGCWGRSDLDCVNGVFGRKINDFSMIGCRGLAVTEQEWQECLNPQAMLEFLKGNASDRKLRLLACANCRLLWKWVTDKRSQEAVCVAERASEELATEEERAVAIVASSEAAGEAASAVKYDDRDHPRYDFAYLLAMAASYARNAVCAEAFVAARANATNVLPEIARLSESLPVQLLHDIFGPLPFRPITTDSRWLTSSVVDLANAIYQDRAFDRMLLLADALMDAGCDNQEVIEHCRNDGVHVRGCWVLDLLLDKK